MTLKPEIQLLTSDGVRELSFTQCYSFIQKGNTELVTLADVNRVRSEHLNDTQLTPEHQEVRVFL